MSGNDRPCLLPHLKERLEQTYGTEKEYYERELRQLRRSDNLDERVEAELETKLKKAADNLDEVRQMSTCPPPTPEEGEEQETSQDPPPSE